MRMRGKIISILLITIVSLLSGLFNNKAFAAGWSDATGIVSGGADTVGNYISFGQYDLQHNGGNLGDVQLYCAQHDRTLTNSRTNFVVNSYIEINGRTGEIRGKSKGGSLNEWHTNGDADIKENKIFATILGGNEGFTKGYGSYGANTKTQKAVWKFFNQSSWVSQNMGAWFKYTHSYSGGNEAYNAAKNSVEKNEGYKGIVKISFLTNANSAAYFQTLMIVTTEDQKEPEGLTIKKVDEETGEIIKGAKFVLSKENPDNKKVEYLKNIKQENGGYKYEWDDLEGSATHLDVKEGEMTLPNFVTYEKDNGSEKFTYTLKETDPPKGYENSKNKDKKTTFKLSDAKDGAIVLEIKNSLLNKGLTIIKIDKETGEVIPGAKFILSKKNPANNEVVYLKNIALENGEYKYEWDDLEQSATRLDIKEGEMTLPDFISYEKNNGSENYEYTLKETDPPKGYENSRNRNKTTTFKLTDAENDIIVVKIENVIGNDGLTIKKVDKETGKIIPGAKFILSKKNPENNEVLYLKNIALENGEYKYEWDDLEHFATHLDVKEGEMTLPDFISYEKNNGSENCEYTLTETTPPPGYENSKNRNKTTTFKLTDAKDEKSIVVTIENIFGDSGLIIRKIDEDTEKIIPGAKFILSKKDSDSNEVLYLQKVVKQDNGEYIYEWDKSESSAKQLYLETGEMNLPHFVEYEKNNENEKYTYTLKEIEPPQGYINHENINKITTFKLSDAEDNDTISLVISNVKLEGQIIIDKVDADDGQQLASVGFRIKYLGEKEEEEEDKDSSSEDDNNSIKITGKYIESINEGTGLIEWTDDIDSAYIFYTGSGDNYSSIIIRHLPIGMYSVIESSNDNAGYESNIGRDWQVEVNRNATTSLVAENKKGGNVKISGKVWEEVSHTKDGAANDQYDGGDNLLEGIKVIWKTDITGEPKIIAQTLTDKNGYYELSSNIRIFNHIYRINQTDYNILNNSYIEFEYNGLKYTTIGTSKEGENTSKATENVNYRNTLDRKFTQVTNSKAGEIQLNYDKTVDHHSVLRDLNDKKDDLETTIDYNSDGGYDFAVRADTKNTGINKLLDNYAKTGTGNYCYMEKSCSKHGTHCYYRDEINSWSIENMNMGLIRREQPDIALSADIEKVRVIMHGQEYTYKYGNLGIRNNNVLFDYKTKFENMEENIYTRAVNPANIAKYALDVQADENNKDELQVYVTYNINAKNESETLGVTVKNIVNYYDPQFEIYRGPDSATSDGWTENGETNNGYNVAYCNFLDSNNAQGKTIESQQLSEMVKIEYRVKPEAVLGLMKKENTVLRNVFEVYTYSSWYAKAGGRDVYTLSADHKYCNEDGRLGNQYAGVDLDSISASTIPGDVKTYEDDTHEAPRFKLARAANYKIVSGTVFEDTQTEESGKRNERLGNGQNENERGIKNVKVELLKVDEETNTTTTADLYRIGDMNGETQKAITYTDENGNFSFGSLSERGVPAGYYVIKYTYGDRVPYIAPNADPNQEALVLLKSTIINKEEYDKVKDNEKALQEYEERYKINARNYKSTIITDNIINSLMDNNNLSEEDLKWHLKTNNNEKIDNMSTAVDDIDQLSWKVEDKDIDLGSHEDARLRIPSLNNGNFESPVNVSAFSLPFKIQVEYTENQEEKVNKEGEKEGNFDDDIGRFDFGLIERAREDIYTDKTILHMNIQLNNGQTLTEGNPFERGMDFVKTAGRDRKNMKVVDGPIPFRTRFFDNNVGKDKQVYVDMDSEYMKSATLKIVYDITVINNSEKDYEYDPNVYEGYDYRGYYYFGRVPSDEYLIKPSVEIMGDYLDKKLSCQAGKNTDNPQWLEVSDISKLKTNELIEGEENDEFTPYGAVNGKYFAFITNGFKNIESGDRHTIQLQVSKNLSNEAEDQKFENHAEILQLNGKIARTIDRTENGEQIKKTYKPGNYVPSNNMRTTDPKAFKDNPEITRLHEQDDDSVVVTITPPTGLTDKSIIYILAGAVGLIVLAAGVFIIKRRIIK